MSKGPLAVEWGQWTMYGPEAGTVTAARLELKNTGSLPWHNEIFLSYHWLDNRDNPIHWDGIRTPAPPLVPGERTQVDVAVRAPIPPGRYRVAFDVVAEHRAWFSELGSSMLTTDMPVIPRKVEPNAVVPDWVERAADWDERVRAAHADGYSVVAGAIEWDGGLLDRRPRELAPYEPGPGRVPGFAAPLLCPSVAPGVKLEPLEDVAGLPAFAAPLDEPWVYDGRIVLRARRRS
ncbi:MAG TPA: hypothetical protein VFW85_08235 [Gaiellaceae bacterium]|nr:hypothetical protein [Gaiellaceae bacterium]